MKTIIKIEPEWNGAHAYLDDVDYDLPGWAVLPEAFRSVWEQYAPFVNITVDENENITDISEGTEIPAPPQPTPPPTVEELKAENTLLKAQIQAQTERSDFVEDCLAEMATRVYSV